jgi:hypothetical protein
VAPLPRAERAVLDLQKIEDYCLDMEHPRGAIKHAFFARLSASDATMPRGYGVNCFMRSLSSTLLKQFRMSLEPIGVWTCPWRDKTGTL